ncbi:Rha family transcriptional regulator [Sutterella wadsworthensis]|uniref:Rha family transcriptional regulator n=1 Tax=Sutterella wadsworthensis TaxID=40545 RepID=UPI00307EA905
MSQIIAANAFKVVEGRPVTSSRIVAEYFGKQHHHVVRDIRTLISQKPDLERNANFGECSETINLANGATRQVPFFWMDRKGFSLLAMGFTGAKALEFKCAFYDEFERMEQALKNPPAPAYITDAQQREIQRAVGRRSEGYGINYQTIYSALKNHFNVPSYKRILEKDFEAAISFIQSVKIMTREECIEHEKAQMKRIEAATYHDEPIPPKVYTVRADFMEKLLSLVYTWRYLHRANLERYVEFLRSVDSPYAASMWEAVHDFNWLSLESSLDKIGYSVKELPCYKHWLSHQPA